MPDQLAGLGGEAHLNNMRSIKTAPGQRHAKGAMVAAGPLRCIGFAFVTFTGRRLFGQRQRSTFMVTGTGMHRDARGLGMHMKPGVMDPPVQDKQAHGKPCQGYWDGLNSKAAMA